MFKRGKNSVKSKLELKVSDLKLMSPKTRVKCQCVYAVVRRKKFLHFTGNRHFFVCLKIKIATVWHHVVVYTPDKENSSNSYSQIDVESVFGL